MTVLNSRIGVICFQKQSAVGTPASGSGAGFYQCAKVSGGMKEQRNREAIPTTRPTGKRPGQFVTAARGDGTVQCLAYPDVMGLWAWQAMGAQATSGAGPYKHTLTMVEDLPTPMTVWDLVGDQWWMFTDCYMQGFVVRGTQGQNLACELHLLSWSVALRGAPTGYAPNTLSDIPRFKFIGSITKVEADTYPPVVVDNVESFELNIDRTLDLRYGASLTPMRAMAARNVDFSCNMIVDTAVQGGWDFTTGSAFGLTGGAAALTGDATGDALSQNIIHGSFDVQSGRHPKDATRFFRAYTPAANWEFIATRPDSNPTGGPLDYDAAGQVIDPAQVGGTGSEVTVEIMNEVAADY
jgi:hypothetical protein